MIQYHSRLVRPIIPEGETYPLSASGRYFRIVDAPSAVIVKVDNCPESVLHAGEGFRFLEGEDFERIELRMLDRQTAKISVWVGYTEFVEAGRRQIEENTEFVTIPGDTITTVAPVVLDGIPRANRTRRKCVVISNLSPEGTLQLFDNISPNPGGVVRPGETINVQTSRYLRIHNPNAAPVAVAMHELWWIL